MQNNHKKYIRKPLENYYKSDFDFSNACKRVFGQGEGAKVLGQLLIDVDYHFADTPDVHQKWHPTLTYEQFLIYRAGMKDFISRMILNTLDDFEIEKQEESLINLEEYND
jgi:hypothetical protein